MAFWKDREGKEVSYKEFKERWRAGIKSLTQLQLTRQQIIGNIIVLIGILVGIVTSIYYKQWWLLIVLVGSLIVSIVTYISTYQKYIILITLEENSIYENEQ